MKRALLLLALISNLLVADDKISHVAVSYGLSYTCSHITKEPWLCVPATLAIGAIKELVIDDKADAKDMYANCVGIGFSIVAWQFD